MKAKCWLMLLFAFSFDNMKYFHLWAGFLPFFAFRWSKWLKSMHLWMPSWNTTVSVPMFLRACTRHCLTASLRHPLDPQGRGKWDRLNCKDGMLWKYPLINEGQAYVENRALNQSWNWSYVWCRGSMPHSTLIFCSIERLCIMSCFRGLPILWWVTMVGAKTENLVRLSFAPCHLSLDNRHSHWVDRGSHSRVGMVILLQHWPPIFL